MNRRLVAKGTVISTAILLAAGLAGCTTQAGPANNTSSPSSSGNAKPGPSASPSSTVSSSNTSQNPANTVQNPSAAQNPANGTPANTSALSGNGSRASTQVAYGWRYLSLTPTFRAGSQIVGLQPIGNAIEVHVSSVKVSGHTYQNVYQQASLGTTNWRFSGAAVSSSKPTAYAGDWSLQFGSTVGASPMTISLVNRGRAVFSLPSSILGYASEINPAVGSPGGWDNQVIGRSGSWVWLAMKGPKLPPVQNMGLVWRFRYWNRIVAIDTHSWKTVVYSIPRSTSDVDTWGNPPAFAVSHGAVYIGTGKWLGVFPVNPGDAGVGAASNVTAATGNLSSNAIALPVVQPEPASVVQADGQKMLQTLSGLKTSAADSLAAFWNNYVMKGDQQADAASSWIMQPTLFNHGDFPESLIWAVNFPLIPGSSVDQQRTKLLSEIEQELKSPLPTSMIAFSTPQQARDHFHSEPPTSLPGYTIQNGYYVRSSGQ